MTGQAQVASGCPVRPFLDLDGFANGTPREALDGLRRGHRALWEADGFSAVPCCSSGNPTSIMY